ncbi:unnamed protein product [Thlaspi arvense]|uniref:Uncharacterized protein n=1 Tax=Thlaspi arvense TaxID=13288 RepID=A0AAU9SPG9_THLAR|nr:unnamed protein product [Thlaspi arvense]
MFLAFETLQALLIQGFQLLDMWINHLAVKNLDCQRSKFLDSVTAGFIFSRLMISVRLQSCILLDIFGLFDVHVTYWNPYPLDRIIIGMESSTQPESWLLPRYRYLGNGQVLAHLVAPWNLVDVVLILNMRALLSAILRRVKGYIKLRAALGALHAALPDATSEQIRAYDDECAICPLTSLGSVTNDRNQWLRLKDFNAATSFILDACDHDHDGGRLDQGLNEVYSCPTCRKPLFVDRTESETNPSTGEVSSDEQLSRQFERQNNPAHALTTGVFPTLTPNSIESDPLRLEFIVPSLRPAKNKLCCCNSEQSSPDVTIILRKSFMATWNRGKTFSGNILGPDVGILANPRALFEDKMSRGLCRSTKSGVT